MLNLQELILNLVNRDLSKVDEKAYLLRLYAIPLTVNTFKLIKCLNSSDYENEIQNIIVNVEGMQIRISLEDEYSEIYEGESATIKIEKKQSYGLRFLFEQGFETYLSEKNTLEEVQYVQLDFVNTSFSSLSTLFSPPSSPKLIQNLIIENVQAIKYTKALNTESQKYLPTNILTWISKNTTDKTPKAWKIWSTLKLFCSLSSELHSDANTLEYYFRGERRKKVTLNLNEKDKLSDLCSEIADCADWIFRQSKDIDTRHYIFNHQMTLALPDDANFHDITDFKTFLKNVIDNSMLVYRYHLQSSSKELAKTLTELNKTLFEYIGKIRQNAADLVTGLWRDLTTVVGLLLLNFALKKPDVIEQNYHVIGFGLCLYLAFSIFLNARMGFWFFKNINNSLSEWRSKIYSYLNDTEFENFAKKPLIEAFKKYKFTFWIVVVFYVLMIVAVSKYTFLAKSPLFDNLWNYIFHTN